MVMLLPVVNYGRMSRIVFIEIFMDHKDLLFMVINIPALY